jgi:hypothetical protein
MHSTNILTLCLRGSGYKIDKTGLIFMVFDKTGLVQF